MSKRIEDLTLIDDGMFQAVMHEPGVCAELVECLLHVKVKSVEFPELEKTIAPYYSSKGVRLDVYLKDEDKVIDVEIQKYTQEAIGKRTRYYQSMIDIDSLMKGEDYPQLKESYILFICISDPFVIQDKETFGLPLYTFKNTCVENPAVQLGDNTTKVVYNASAYKNVKDEKIQGFLQLVSTNKPGEDEFSRKLSELVEKLKENEKFRSEYAAMNLHDRDIISQAKKEASLDKAIEDATNLLKENISVEIIAKCTGLEIEKVLELQKEIVQ